MKQVATILLIFLILLLSLSKVWIVVSFKINQDNIAKILCVKKENQNNTCQGNCQLKKQLEEAEQEEQKQSPQNSKQKIEVWYFQPLKPFVFVSFPFFFENKLLNFPPSNSYFFSFLLDIFHPPQFHLI